MGKSMSPLSKQEIEEIAARHYGGSKTDIPGWALLAMEAIAREAYERGERRAEDRIHWGPGWD